MDRFSEKNEWFSFELKRNAGFGKDGEKNFEGTVTDLQMRIYLLIRDFRQRVNKKGTPYGGPFLSIPRRRPSGDMNTSHLHTQKHLPHPGNGSLIAFESCSQAQMKTKSKGLYRNLNELSTSLWAVLL